jgi:hypothetical protein
MMEQMQAMFSAKFEEPFVLRQQFHYRILPVIALLMPFCLSNPANAKTVAAWKSVVYADLAGKFKATLTRDQLLYDTGVFKMLMIPPHEQLLVLNADNHTYLRTPASQWPKHRRDWPNLKKIGTGKMLQMACEHYRGKMSDGSYVDAWYTHALSTNPALTTMACQACDMPNYGLPIKVTLVTPRDRTVVYECYKVEQTTVDSSIFVLPKDYRAVPDKAVLWFSTDGKSADFDGLFISKPAESKRLPSH